MNRISKSFRRGKMIIVSLMGGDPGPAGSEAFVISLLDAGADMAIIGIPFSDPAAESPAQQKAHLRAIQAGTDTSSLFDLARRLRQKTDKPLLFQTYLNPIFHYGYQLFFSDCREVGIDGVIPLDLPYEERHQLLPHARSYGVDLIPIVAPTSGGRLADIVRDTDGFIYLMKSPDPRQTAELACKVAETSSGHPVVIEWAMTDDLQTPAVSLTAADGVILTCLSGLIEEQEEATRGMAEVRIAMGI